ncbi:hypothetical protein CLV43_122104 [Umezawaea tangerina]|uniref:Uncharacterized protein n=1 Tax=Umezawaea tangerina TaxID=84725 RepID=A0A2T0SE47_9PSEU|nr:hypothetical protein CLV43_122104 [Umezawaea tangerina]
MVEANPWTPAAATTTMATATAPSSHRHHWTRSTDRHQHRPPHHRPPRQLPSQPLRPQRSRRNPDHQPHPPTSTSDNPGPTHRPDIVLIGDQIPISAQLPLDARDAIQITIVNEHQRPVFSRCLRSTGGIFHTSAPHSLPAATKSVSPEPAPDHPSRPSRSRSLSGTPQTPLPEAPACTDLSRRLHVGGSEWLRLPRTRRRTPLRPRVVRRSSTTPMARGPPLLYALSSTAWKWVSEGNLLRRAILVLHQR